MAVKFLIISADSTLDSLLSPLADKQGFLSQRFACWTQLPARIDETSLLLIDLDSVPTDNTLINNIKTENPEMHIIATSKERFHPHLGQSLQKNVLAVLNKPLDLEELQFWLHNAIRQKNTRDLEPTAYL